jgi:transcriptional regulator with XRE-family HTH domain
VKKADLVRQVTGQLAELRRSLGVTQEELAERLDVPVQHVSRIESGAQNITLATLERFSIALGVRVTVAFEATRVGPRKPPKTTRQRLAWKPA